VTEAIEMFHPARLMEFDDLYDGIIAAREGGLINETSHDGLSLYCYSRSAVYDRIWTPITLMCRGLILDIPNKRVVATPFTKFFNCGEGDQTIPDLPFETFEKVDGSLIIIWWSGGQWRTATKGSLRSDQARWAAGVLARSDLSALTKGTTYLAEAVYGENRIVIHYDESGLVLLGAFDEGGAELTYDALQEIGAKLGWRTAKRYQYSAVSELLAKAETLPADEEGFVLRFSNGLRLKIKGEEYRRIHALISRCTPLAMWNAMLAGDDLDKVRRDLPEEFWTDFDGITSALQRQISGIIAETEKEAKAVAHLSDKEVGLSLDKFPPSVRGFIFPYRKSGGDILSGRSRRAVFGAVRPTGNRLDGYIPSYAMNRVLDEEG
jgi:RNA ligase